MSNHLSNHIKHSTLKSNNTLHVIGVIQNPVRFHSRYRLFQDWASEILSQPNTQLHVVEAIYGDRQAECAPTVLDYNYLSVQIDSEIWLKENLINIAIKNLLPSDWKYVAWIDCDVSFHNPDWAQATLHQLQHYNIVQPWTHAIDLDFYGGIFKTVTSFGYLCATRQQMYHGPNKDPYKYAHSGYAWACTRYFYENVEKLLDFSIIGAGDHNMAWACLDKVEDVIHKKVSKEYVDLCLDWQRKASRACAKIVGYTNGYIRHGFHGPKSQRKYWDRWNILIGNNYNPQKDICYDSQGVLTLCGANKYAIEQDMMVYNRGRAEDSIDMY